MNPTSLHDIRVIVGSSVALGVGLAVAWRYFMDWTEDDNLVDDFLLRLTEKLIQFVRERKRHRRRHELRTVTGRLVQEGSEN